MSNFCFKVKINLFWLTFVVRYTTINGLTSSQQKERVIWMNIKKYEEIKRRIVALALASSIGFTSFALSGCKSKNDIIDGEASNGYSSVLDRYNSIDMNNSGEWFCDVWAEDYDNNKISGIKFELRDNKNNLIEEWTSSNTPHRITGLSAGK